MICTCGTYNNPGIAFCPNCNRRLITPTLEGTVMVLAFSLGLWIVRGIADAIANAVIEHRVARIKYEIITAMSQIANQSWDSCLETAQRLSKDITNSEDVRAWYHFLAGCSYLGKEQLEEARTHFDILVEMPNTSGFGISKAMQYMLQGVIVYAEWTKSTPKSSNKLQKAIDAFTSAAKYAPNNPQIRYRKGLALGQADRNEEALVELNQAVLYAPNDVEAISYRAVVNAKLGKLDNGFADAQRTLALDPNNYAAQQVLAIVLGLK